MGLFGGPGHVAAHLFRMLATAADKGHHRGGVIPPLLLHHREIHRPGVDAWRRAGFQAADVERQFPQTLGKGIGRRITGTTAGMVLHADMNNTAEESTGGEYHSLRVEADTSLGNDASYLVVFDNQVVRRLLEQGQVRLTFQGMANGSLIENAICLGTGGSHGRSLAAVQYPELDTGLVGGFSHGATEGIYLFHQMAFTNASDGRVTGHLTQGFNVVGQQQGLGTHACSRQRGLGTGMATTNDNDIETGRKIHSSPRKSGIK